LKADKELQRKFFDWMHKELALRNREGWYLVNNREVDRHGGKELLDSLYEGQLWRALEAVYSDTNHSWDPWRFPKVPDGYWNELANQRKFFEWLYKTLKLRNMDGWYTIHVREAQRYGGRVLLSMHNNDMAKALSAVYPEHKFDVWRFGTVPEGFWDSRENLKKFFDWAHKDLQLKTLDGWYRVYNREIERRGGKAILTKYKGYLGHALAEVYPEKEWQIWRFQELPKDYWNDKSVHRKYFESVSKDLNLKSLEGWYHVSKSDVSRYGSGGPMPLFYGNSLSVALMELFPEHKWVIWRFSKVPEGFWDKVENRRSFFEWLYKELKLKDTDGWYRVTRTSVARYGGSALLAMHQDSLPKTLQAIYPEHTFNIWRFQQTPKSTWNDIRNQRSFFEWLGKKMGLRDLSGWYKIVKLDLVRYGGRGMMGAYNHHLSDALLKIFPDHAWEPWQFWKAPTGFWDSADNQRTFFDWYMNKKRQFKTLEGWYEVTTKELEANGGKALMPRFYGSVFMAVSSIYPEHKWDAFRFKQAYDGYWSVPVSVGTRLSYMQKIALKRPDLLKEPMPTEADPSFKPRRFTFNERRNLWGGAFALGQYWDGKEDPTGYWMSEKIDGVRVMWDGEMLYSRSGLALKLPRFFTDGLPKLFLDGELWMGRSRGEDIADLCRKAKPTNETDEWDDVTYVVFDIPEYAELPYEKRMEILDSLKLGTYSRPIGRRKCTGLEDMQNYLKEITDNLGEGIMLRKPETQYVAGRSSTTLKVVKHREAEVQFVGPYQRNKTLLCEQPDGNICVATCPPDIYQHPPKANSVITVRYTGIRQNGKFRNASFVRERPDVTWEDVLRNAEPLLPKTIPKPRLE
jgi:hypothetical protein